MASLQRTLTAPAELERHGLTTHSERHVITDVANRYAIAITPQIAGLIKPHSISDPIARQFVPTAAELQNRPDELSDPISDDPFSPVPGIVHRYHDRALLKLTSICPVYCRFCFRREMVGPHKGGTLDRESLDVALDYISRTHSLREIIVTGGDPLILSPRRISEITARLATVSHIEAIRWHSRVPVVMSDHVTPDLITALRAPGRRVRVAVHANHPREFTPAAQAALARLTAAKIGLLSQSVLLKGVNDETAILATLVQAFIAAGVQPYYLHHLDLAPGTSHFHVPISRGLELMRALGALLPGTVLPQYTLDIPGGHGKVALTPQSVDASAADTYRVTDRQGQLHVYRDPRDQT